MLVYLDTANRTITIVEGKIVKTLPFSYLREITKTLEEQDVTYVSDVIETTGEEVVSMVKSLLEEDDAESANNGTLYLRTTTRSKVNVKHGTKSYYFEGLYDCKPLHLFPNGFVDECRQISDGLKNGTFEIINEQTRIFLMDQQQEEKDAKVAKMESERANRNQKGSVSNPIEIDI